MNCFRCFYILFCMVSFYTNAKAAFMLVKLSNSDCLFCNMQLLTLKKINRCQIYVAIPERQKEDEDLRNLIIEFGQSDNLHFIFSDSLFYLLDSSERSICYITEGKKIKYKSYLKTVNVLDLENAIEFSANSIIDYPDVMLIRQTDNYLFMGGNKKYILKVNKKRLFVEDTLWVNTGGIKGDLFKVSYGDKYLAELDSFKAISKREHIPNTFSINDFCVKDDTTWVMATTDVILKINGEIHVRNIPYIITYCEHKLIDIKQIENSVLQEGPDSVYTLNNSNFYVSNGYYYLSIRRSGIGHENNIYAKCQVRGNKIILSNSIPLRLPVHMVKNKIGYLMQTGISADNILSNEYSNDLYDIISRKSFYLPFGHLENKFTNEEVNSLRFDVAFEIYTFSLSDSCLNILYSSGDSLINAQCYYDRKNIKFTSRQLIAHPYPDKNNFENCLFACDKNGIYNFNVRMKKFNYYPYQ